MHARRTMTLATLLGAIGLLAPAAPAQQPANQSGRALDANQRVGSGGVNRLEGQVDYRQRNDIVTGNVGGGAAFRDTVPYRAPGEFGDQLGSDDLFGFRRDTLQSAPTRLNAPAPSVNLGGRPSVFREFSGVPGNVVSAPIYRDQLGPSGASYNYANFYGTNPLAGAGNLNRDLDPGQTTLGYTSFEGRQLEVSMSPLLGVRQRELDLLPLDRLNQTRPLPQRSDGTEEEAPSNALQGTRLGPLEPYQPLLAPDLTRLPGQPADGEGEAEGEDEQTRAWVEGGRISPTMILGRQMQERLGRRADEPQNPVAMRRINRLTEQLTRADEQNQAQDQPRSPYDQILQALRDSETPGTAPGASPEAEAAPDAERPGADRDRGQAADEGAPDLAAPARDQLREAEEARQRVLQRLYGNEVPGDGGDAAQQEGGAGAQPGAATTPLDDLLARLDYDLPRLQSLAPDDGSQATALMRRAESSLADGRYFDAEAAYRQVISRRPDDPLARVGLVHAQLGAGMIRSAAFNLRSLFESHPEVIAAKYGQRLLPESQRLQWLRMELERQVGESGGEAGLMMAYLGYQADSPQLIRYGLAVAEAQEPRDPLWPVLRRIWIDQPRDGQAQDAGASDGATSPAVESE